jgi:hypothetical protein
MGADISHERAFDECMDDNWGVSWGKARLRHEGISCPHDISLEPPMV